MSKQKVFCHSFASKYEALTKVENGIAKKGCCFLLQYDVKHAFDLAKKHR